MKMFLTPETTFSTGIRWSESLNNFLPCDQRESEFVFKIATPTRAQVHQHLGALNGFPGRGSSLDYSELDELIWGTEHRPGLVREVLPATKAVPHPSLTLALARIVREELGMSVPLKEEAPDAPKPDTPPSLDAEGNSGSPSGSGSVSSET